MTFAVTPSTYDLRDNWQLQVFDQNGNLVDIPQSDVEEIRVQKVLNGGSGEGTITFRRRFNDIGAVGYVFSFRLWIWPAGTTMPTDPYWTGIQEDPDQVQLGASGQCVVHCYGDFTLLNDGLVSLECNPGINGNPSLDSSSLLTTLLAPNQPPGFATPVIPGSMFPLLPVTYTHQGLGDVLNDLLQQGRDSTGLLFTWRVTVNRAGQRQIVIKIDQNPNVLDGTGGKALVLFRHLFANSDFDTYKIANKYRDIYNIVAVYGATDPTTGAQAFGVYEDTTSQTDFGRVKEYAINVPSLATNDACQAYGQIWLDLNAYPTAEGSCRLLRCDPTIDVGTWVQFWEAPSLPNGLGGLNAPSIKQVRISQVDLVITKPNRVEQSLTSTSPVPYLDKAIYRVGAEIQTQTTISNLPLFPVKQTLYIRSGGTLSSSSDSPAKVALTACEAVFPQASGDSKITRLSALALTQLTDNSGGPNNGQTGDGNYAVSVTRSGSWIITKGDRPANVSTQQNVLGAYVVGGIPFCVDIRILAGYPAFSPDLGAPTLAPSTVVTVGVPANAGAGAVDVPIDFYLDPATWTNANHRLSYFEVGATPSGSGQPVATYTKVIPTVDGHITTAIPGIGAGSTMDYYVTAFDNLDRPTPALFLATATAAKVKVGVGIANVDSSLAAPTMSNNGSLTNVPDPVDTAHAHPTHGDISTIVDLTNVASDGSMFGVYFVFREHGTSTWVPAGQVDFTGNPTPANQNVGFVYSLATGKIWDFACGYFGLGGYGALTQIGTTAQKSNGFTARAMVVQGKYLDEGSIVTPSIGDTVVCTLSEVGGSHVGDVTFTVNSVSQLQVGQQVNPDLNDPMTIISINSGTNQFTVGPPGAAHTHANGANIYAARAWNGISLNGVSADVMVQFDITNPPTDGTFARVLLWARRHNGTGHWQLLDGTPAPGKLTTPETYPTTASFTMGASHLTNGDTYDFAVTMQATSGRESAKTVIISGFQALALNLPTSSLPGTPAGTTCSATGSISSYSAVLGGTYHANFTVTPTVGSTPAFSSWGAGFKVLAKVNDSGSTDGDTDHTHYAIVGDLVTNNWTSGSINGQTAGLSAGHAFQLAIAPYSQQNDGLGPVAIFALTTAQKIGSGAVQDGPNLVQDPLLKAASLNSSGHATSAPHWALYSGVLPIDGTTIFIGAAGDRGVHALQITSAAGGSGVGANGTNVQAMSEAIDIKGGETFCVSAWVGARGCSAGTVTGSVPPSIAIVTHSGASAWDPAKNDPNSVSYAPQSSLIRAQAAQTMGLAGIVSATYTPSSDEQVSVVYQSGGTKSGGGGGGLLVFMMPQLQDGTAPGPFNAGGGAKKGRRPVIAPPTTWTTPDGPADTQGGAALGTGGGIEDHRSASWQTQSVIDTASNILNVQFAGTKIGKDGTITGVPNGAGSNAGQSRTYATSEQFRMSGKFQIASGTPVLRMGIGNSTNGYVVNINATSVQIAKIVGGTVSGLGTVKTVAEDTNWHSFALTVTCLGASSNKLEASFDDAAPLLVANDVALDLTTGSWAPWLFDNNNGTTKWSNLDINGYRVHHSSMSGGVQAALDSSGNGLAVQFTGTKYSVADDTITGVPNANGSNAVQSRTYAVGEQFVLSGKFQCANSGVNVQMGITSGGANGYVINMGATSATIAKDIANVVTNLAGGTLKSFTRDALWHSFKITITVLGASSNKIEASIDDAAPVTIANDTNFDLTTGSWSPWLFDQNGGGSKFYIPNIDGARPHHTGMSAGTQAAVDNAGNLLNVEFAGTKVNSKGVITGWASTQIAQEQLPTLVAGDTIEIDLMLEVGSTGGTIDVGIADTSTLTNGYTLRCSTTGVHTLRKTVASTGTNLTTGATVAQDTKYHGYKMTIGVVGASSNVLEGSIGSDGLGPTPDTAIDLTSGGPWFVYIAPGNTPASSLIKHFRVGVAKNQRTRVHPDYQVTVQSGGGIDFSSALHSHKDLDHIADGATYARVLGSDTSSNHVTKTFDGTTSRNIKGVGDAQQLSLDFEIADGTSYKRVVAGDISSGHVTNTYDGTTVRPIKGVGDAQQLDLTNEVKDGATHKRVLATEFASGANTIKQLNDGTNTRTAAHVAGAIDTTSGIYHHPFGKASAATISPTDGAIVGLPAAAWTLTNGSYAAGKCIFAVVDIKPSASTAQFGIAIGNPAGSAFAIYVNNGVPTLVKYSGGTPTTVATGSTIASVSTGLFYRFRIAIDFTINEVEAIIEDPAEANGYALQYSAATPSGWPTFANNLPIATYDSTGSCRFANLEVNPASLFLSMPFEVQNVIGPGATGLRANTVSSSQLGPNAVGSGAIAPSAVTAAKLANNAVDFTNTPIFANKNLDNVSDGSTRFAVASVDGGNRPNLVSSQVQFGASGPSIIFGAYGATGSSLPAASGFAQGTIAVNTNGNAGSRLFYRNGVPGWTAFSSP